jgi:hypothetical protein
MEDDEGYDPYAGPVSLSGEYCKLQNQLRYLEGEDRDDVNERLTGLKRKHAASKKRKKTGISLV